jgi:hypothetical protein
LESRLVSQAWAEQFLGTDRKGIMALIKQRKLKRDPLTGAFLREQVLAVEVEIARGLMYDGEDGTAMGSEQPKMGMLDQFRQEPNLV